jgi:acyl-CoA synthetase (AMP-forming)/AMP-acid ligase II
MTGLGVDALTVGRAPGEVAIEVEAGPRLSVAELRGAVRALAAELAAPGRPPGALAIACATPWETLIAALAGLAAGVPVAVERPARAVAFAGAALRVTRVAPAPVFEIAAPAVPVPAGAALLVATSGTTGAHRWAAFDAAAVGASIAAILGYLPVAGARTAVTLPLSHAYALVGQALVGIAGGATLVWPATGATGAELVVGFHARGVDGWSTVAFALAEAARAATTEPGWRPAFLASAGGALDRGIAAAVRAAFPSARLFDQYGLTEAGPRVAAIDADDPRFAAGSVGRPLPGVELWIEADGGGRAPPGVTGEITLRSPSVMLGYAGASDAAGATRLRDGELHTGDRGHLDSEGYLHVTGRADDLVNVAGERVSLARIAAVLGAALGDPAAVAVAPVPDARLGVRLVAVVAAADGAGVADALRRVAMGALAPAERPRDYLIVPALPRGVSGKLDRVGLRRAAEDHVTRRR